MSISLRQSPKFLSLIIGLHVVFLSCIVAATLQEAKIAGTYYAVASLLGLSAYTLMWLHYVVSWLHDTWWPNVSLRSYMKLTGWIVLGSILLHPLLIIVIFKMLGLGLPPASYAAYAGNELMFINIAIAALVAFLLFELGRWLRRRPVWSLIALLSNLGMILIFVHGARLGLALQSVPFLQVLWGIYGIGYVLILIRMVRSTSFQSDLRTVFRRPLLFIPFIIVLLATIPIVINGALSAGKGQSATTTNDSNTSIQPSNSINSSTTNSTANTSSRISVTAAELAANNGKNGTACWVAIDGIVYQIVSNQWVNGQHIRSNLAYCGADMSEVIKKSPHGKSVLSSQTIIGTYAG